MTFNYNLLADCGLNFLGRLTLPGAQCPSPGCPPGLVLVEDVDRVVVRWTCGLALKCTPVLSVLVDVLVREGGYSICLQSCEMDLPSALPM